MKYAVCDRCLGEKRAENHERFTFMGTDYELDLCDKHADMLQRDMGAWTRVAREVERPTYFPAVVELPRPERVIPLPEPATGDSSPKPPPAETAEPAVEPIPVSAMQWRWSEHAEKRLAERGPQYGFDRRDVLLAIAKGVTYPVADEPKKKRKVLGPVSVVVEPRKKTIVTVMPNSLTWGRDLETV